MKEITMKVQFDIAKRYGEPMAAAYDRLKTVLDSELCHLADHEVEVSVEPLPPYKVKGNFDIALNQSGDLIVRLMDDDGNVLVESEASYMPDEHPEFDKRTGDAFYSLLEDSLEDEDFLLVNGSVTLLLREGEDMAQGHDRLVHVLDDSLLGLADHDICYTEILTGEGIV